MMNPTKNAKTKLNTYLGQKGYTLLKSELSVDEQTFIRRELTVRPFMPGSPAKLPEFPVYRESKSKLYVPRYFGVDHFGEPDETKLPAPIPINIVFGSELRDYQKEIVSKFLSFKAQGGGLLDIPCGRGKTVMALNILAQVGLKTLVIVHKEFLLNQWVERIQQFLPPQDIIRILMGSKEEVSYSTAMERMTSLFKMAISRSYLVLMIVEKTPLVGVFPYLRMTCESWNG